jgi:hypothetical protein
MFNKLTTTIELTFAATFRNAQYQEICNGRGNKCTPISARPAGPAGFDAVSAGHVLMPLMFIIFMNSFSFQNGQKF